MATLKLGSNSLLTLTSRITTPSIHIQKDGNHWYVPLFSGDKGSVIQSGDYNYTLGGLKVGSYRAVVGREVIKIRVFATVYTTWILTPNGELYGCGSNDEGAQSAGEPANIPYILTFTKRASNVKDFCCSMYTTWYIDNNNDLYGCGHNDYGQQGSGDTTIVTVFTKRASNVKKVSCSTYTTWYIDNNNNLYGCGDDFRGAQGSGLQYNNEVLVFTKRAENVKDFCCSPDTTWYIDNNNDLYGCGHGAYGQQGSGDRYFEVNNFTKRASNVKKVRCTDETTWYIDNNNDLYGCGLNDYGGQGSGESGNTSHVTVFTKRAENVKDFCCSRLTTWYIDNNNDLYGCGYNFRGQQGSGDTTNVLTFTKRASNVREVVCTEYITWYIDNNNNLYGCGNNGYGQQSAGEPANIPYVLTFTKRASNVREVVCTEYTTWYIDNNNNLYGCGESGQGQQGSGNGNYVSVFTKRDYKN